MARTDQKDGSGDPSYKAMRTIATIIFLLVPLNLLMSWESILLGQELTGSIKGNVRDDKGNPLPGVNIVLVGTRIGAVSDQQGKYEIKRVLPGSYQMIATMVGYKSDTKTEVIVRPGVVQEVNFNLEQTVIEIPAIDVIEERLKQQQSDVRSSLYFLAPRSAKAIPGIGEDVLRALQALPGIVAPNDFSAQLVVRGSGPDQNLIIMDDIEIFNPYRLYGLISMFNPETVTDIALLTGGFPARYGDRLSAVLDVTNKEGNRNKAFRANVNASISNANVVMEGRLPFGVQGAYMLSTRRTYYDLIVGPFAKSAGLVSGDVAFPNFSDLQGKIVFGPLSRHRFIVNGLRSRDGVDIVSGTKRSSPDSIDAFNETNHHVVGAAWHYTPNENLFLKAIASFYRNDGATEFRGSFLDPSLNRDLFGESWRDSLGIRLVTVSSQSDYVFQKFSLRKDLAWRVGAHLVEAGVGVDFLKTLLQWRVDLDPAIKAIIQGRGRSVPERFEDSKTYARFNAYVQDRIQIGQRWYLQPGLRLDYYHLLRKFYLAPRIQTSFAWDGMTTLRAAYGWYFQSPGYEKLIDQRRQRPFLSLEPQYARSLHAEKATHYVLGVDRWLRGDVQLKIDTYFKSFTNLMVPRIVEGTRYVTSLIHGTNPRRRESWTQPTPVRADSVTNVPTNDGRGSAYGIELFLEKKRLSTKTRFYGWAAYALAWANRKERGYLFPFDFDQRHTINLVGNYLLLDWLEIGFHWRYGSNFPYWPAKGVKPRIVPVRRGNREVYVVQTDAFGNVVFDVDYGGYENNNSARKPAYHRLDVRATAYTTFWGLQWSFYLDIINVYNRSNLLHYDYYVNDDLTLGVRKTSMFPILPTLGLSIKL